jgi:hypothetical protein
MLAFPCQTLSWYSTWAYRKSFTLSHAAGTLTNYQVPIKFYYGAGMDGTEQYENMTIGKVYLNNCCRTDFGDVRVTNSSSSVLNPWTENVTTGVSSLQWFKVDSIGTGSTSFYVYYGNPSATSISNGANVFVSFDDFEWGTNGEDLYNGNWYENQGTAVISTAEAYGGTRSGEWEGTSNWNTVADYYTGPAIADNESISFRVYRPTSNDWELDWGSADIYDADLYTYLGNLYYNSGGGGTEIGSCPVNSWQLFEYRNLSLENLTCQIYQNGSYLATSSISKYMASYAAADFSFNSANSTNYWLDNFYIRQFSSTDPAFGTWGVQQSLHPGGWGYTL